jgi:hypothetical protein
VRYRSFRILYRNSIREENSLPNLREALPARVYDQNYGHEADSVRPYKCTSQTPFFIGLLPVDSGVSYEHRHALQDLSNRGISSNSLTGYYTSNSDASELFVVVAYTSNFRRSGATWATRGSSDPVLTRGNYATLGIFEKMEHGGDLIKIVEERDKKFEELKLAQKRITSSRSVISFADPEVENGGEVNTYAYWTGQSEFLETCRIHQVKVLKDDDILSMQRDLRG